jgi:hypothetical protein
MELAVIALLTLACSAVMSILAFMIGRCGRKLPIDGMLPRVVRSARFSPEKDRSRPRQNPQHPPGPTPARYCQQRPGAADAPPHRAEVMRGQ